MFFFFQAEDGIRDLTVTGVQTCALPISTTGRVLDVLEGLTQGAAGRRSLQYTVQNQPGGLIGLRGEGRRLLLKALPVLLVEVSHAGIGAVREKTIRENGFFDRAGVDVEPLRCVHRV